MSGIRGLFQRRHRNATPAANPRSVTGHSYRVLMIAPTSFFADYGCHIRILEEARILQSRGHQVTLATYRNGSPVAELDIRRTLPIPWRQAYEVGSSRHKIAFDFLLGLTTLRLLLTQPVDVIHAHLHEGALIGLVLGRLFRIPVLFDFQGSMTEEMIDHRFLRRQSAFYNLLRRLEGWIDRQAALVLPSTANSARLLVEEFGCAPQRVQILTDRVNTEVFTPRQAYAGAELAALKAQLGVPAARKVIVYLGLLAPYQGVDHLLEAMAPILAQRPDVHLLLMGYPSVDLYRIRAQALGIDQHVTFTGRVAYGDAPRYLALGDVAAAPKMSKSEGAGKLLNYMAVGLPTVAYDTPVAREYLGNGGFLADFGDVTSLATQLLAALAVADGADEGGSTMGQHLRQRAAQHFSWRHAAAQMEQAYAKLSQKPTGLRLRAFFSRRGGAKGLNLHRNSPSTPPE